jgi:hypothetical protein
VLAPEALRAAAAAALAFGVLTVGARDFGRAFDLDYRVVSICEGKRGGLRTFVADPTVLRPTESDLDGEGTGSTDISVVE